MGDRAATRAMVVRRALARRPWPVRRVVSQAGARRILVAHNLLLGDTVMASGLLAKLRENHPEAEVTLLAQPAFVPLYSSRPWGVRALPFRPADVGTTRALMDEEPFDLAFVLGDNRYSWLARAMRARHVVAHAGDTPWTKDWCVDEHRPYPRDAATWTDMVAELADGIAPRPFTRGDWTAPAAAPFARPKGRYAVLHVGASTPLKFWPADRWRALAHSLSAGGLDVVWSGGRGEEPLVAAIDPEGQHPSFAGQLDLPQMWQLLAGAALLVAPDTGIAHIGRLTWTPTVTLYGPGSAGIAGTGHFWRRVPARSVTMADFPCRDQRLLFRRELDWVRRCSRTTAECARPRCMEALDVDSVLAAAATVVMR